MSPWATLLIVIVYALVFLFLIFMTSAVFVAVRNANRKRNAASNEQLLKALAELVSFDTLDGDGNIVQVIKTQQLSSTLLTWRKENV